MAHIPSDALQVDCSGLIAFPGLVDLHTHLREPGHPEAETVLSGATAAASGGYTAVFAMANTSPVAESPAAVERVAALGRRAGLCDVYPVGAVSVGLNGIHLADIAGMALSRAQVRMFSDDGKCVADAALMRDALMAVHAVGGIVAQHAQDPLLTVGAQVNEGVVSKQLDLPGWPAMAEEAVIARDVVMAHHLGARLHICHISTAGSVEVIRWAKAQGFPVTAEVTPHHLTLVDGLARTKDAVYKVTPRCARRTTSLQSKQPLWTERSMSSRQPTPSTFAKRRHKTGVLLPWGCSGSRPRSPSWPRYSSRPTD